MEEGNERNVLPEFRTPRSVELVRYMRDEACKAYSYCTSTSLMGVPQSCDVQTTVRIPM